MAKTFGDESGLLWHKDVYIGRSASKEKVLKGPKLPPPINYVLPEYRSILGHHRITLDIETNDPNLEAKGPGVYRGDGFIIGIAIGYSDGDNLYYPLRHSVGDNFDPVRFLAVLATEAAEYSGILINANLQYDLDWLGSEGVHFSSCKFFDVQYAEPLLDENKLSYKLDLLAKQYLGVGKFTSKLEENYGPDYIKHLKDIHPFYVGEYACGDVYLPPLIMDKQLPLLEQQGLTALCDMEHELLPLYLQLRRVGVRVDIDRAEKAKLQCDTQTKDIARAIHDLVGFDVGIYEAHSIATAFDKLGIVYPRTSRGQPSFRREWLENHNSKLANLVTDQRRTDKVSSTFLRNFIIEGSVNGRIHCMFNPLRSEGGGTVSGRMSSSYPNLQQIPARDGVLGPMCRSIFIPEEGQEWGCVDWSQIEFRFLVHYAVAAKCRNAEIAAQMYIDDRGTDFHAMAASITHQSRDLAKTTNFATVYGQGKKGTAANLGVSMEEAEKILKEFHTRLPWLKEIYNKASRQAESSGMIRTILGRRRHFDVWEKSEYGAANKDYIKQSDYDLLDNSGKRGYKRAHTHKALNSLLQGSSADLMKCALLKAYKAGIFKVLTPHILVHDEVDFSKPRTPEGDEAYRDLIFIMENTIPLKVPVIASSNVGANWYEAK